MRVARTLSSLLIEQLRSFQEMSHKDKEKDLTLKQSLRTKAKKLTTMHYDTNIACQYVFRAVTFLFA